MRPVRQKMRILDNKNFKHTYVENKSLNKKYI
jgi:hypothetical protein